MNMKNTNEPKKIVTAWDWNDNEALPIAKRKVHALVSQVEKKEDLKRAESWQHIDQKNLHELFDLHKQGAYIASGYREEWHPEAHGYGSGYSYFLGVKVEDWSSFTKAPQNINEYLSHLSDDTVNQIAWISESSDSIEDHKKFIVVFCFTKLITGRVIQEIYQYISEIPGGPNKYEEFVPRIIEPTDAEAQWIGGSISLNICNDIIEKARQNSAINRANNTPNNTTTKILDPMVADLPRLDVDSTIIDGLINYKLPIFKPEDKQRIHDKANSFHGFKSRNWESESSTLKQWFDKLNHGFHIAPGHFEYSGPDESRRLGKAFRYTHVILLDVDEWEENGIVAPESVDQWFDNLPNSISQWITWIGESASSRSKEKPELRLRVAIAFEKPISGKYFVEIAKYLHKYIPGTSLRVAKDKVRLSYGNGRKDSTNRWFGGALPGTIIDEIISQAHEKELENERRQFEKQQWFEEEKVRKVQLRKEGKLEDERIAPWEAFDLDAADYITSIGYTKTSDNPSGDGWYNYSRPGGDPGKPSIGIRLSPNRVWRISSFSTSISWPGEDGTISLLEFYCSNKYNLDITGGIEGHNSSNFKQAMEFLSKEGYGDWGQNFSKKYKEAVSEFKLEIPFDPRFVDDNKDIETDTENKEEPPPYWDIEKNKLKHNYTINRDYYTEPKGNPDALNIAQNYKVAWLDGPPGVAKTTFQVAHARLLPSDEKKLVAGPRKLLAENLAAYLNNELHYEGELDQNIAVSMPVKYIHGDVKVTQAWTAPEYMLTTTIHSMLRSIRVLNEKSVGMIHLSLDEIDFIIQSLYSPQLHGKAQEILDEITAYAEQNTIYLTGATASTGLILEFVETLGLTEDDVCQISIERKAKKGGTLLFAKVKIKEIIDTIANAVDTLPKKTKIFVGFADKEHAKTLKEHPKIKKRGKVQMVTSENSQDPEVKKLLTESTLEEMNIDVLIVSPSVDVGVNLFGEDTQVIIVRAATFGAPVKTSWQQARRVRNTQRAIWYISGEIDWTKSLTLQELQLCKKQKVIDNFIYYISNPRTTEGDIDNGIFAELNAAGRRAAEELKNLSYEELMEGDILNGAQKRLLEDSVKRSQLEARIEWEAEQELLFEQQFIEYHAQREGMTFEIWQPEAPTEEQITITSKDASNRKREEKRQKIEDVNRGIVEHDFDSLEEIESKRKANEYENNQYEVAIEVNNRMQKVGVPDIVLGEGEGEVREQDVQRAVDMMEYDIEPQDFQRKYEVHEALNNPHLANERYYWKATKDLNKAACKPIQAKLAKYINDNLSYIAGDYIEVFYREILHLAKQNIMINNKGIETTYVLSDAIFIHFPETLRSYRRMRRYGTTEAKALYTLFNKILKQYLHRSLVIIGEKGKKREVQDLPDIELYQQYFEEVTETEQYYKNSEVDIVKDKNKRAGMKTYIPETNDFGIPTTEPLEDQEFNEDHYIDIEF